MTPHEGPPTSLPENLGGWLAVETGIARHAGWTLPFVFGCRRGWAPERTAEGSGWGLVPAAYGRPAVFAARRVRRVMAVRLYWHDGVGLADGGSRGRQHLPSRRRCLPGACPWNDPLPTVLPAERVHPRTHVLPTAIARSRRPWGPTRQSPVGYPPQCSSTGHPSRTDPIGIPRCSSDRYPGVRIRLVAVRHSAPARSAPPPIPYMCDPWIRGSRFNRTGENDCFKVDGSVRAEAASSGRRASR